MSEKYKYLDPSTLSDRECMAEFRRFAAYVRPELEARNIAVHNDMIDKLATWLPDTIDTRTKLNAARIPVKKADDEVADAKQTPTSSPEGEK